MLFQQIRSASTGAYSYLLGQGDNRIALVIDPTIENLDVLLALIGDLNLDLRFILLSHVHAGKDRSAKTLAARTGGIVVSSARCKLPGVDRHVDHDDHVAFGDDVIHVIATPGHTPCSVCYRWRDRLFTGDTLLAGNCGEARRPDGDPGQLYDSVINRLFLLPPEILVFPGSDPVGRTVSTIAEEKATNPCFNGRSRDAFVSSMSVPLPPAFPLPRMRAA